MQRSVQLAMIGVFNICMNKKIFFMQSFSYNVVCLTKYENDIPGSQLLKNSQCCTNGWGVDV